jgi:mono/diheme cytochrome c family protein
MRHPDGDWAGYTYEWNAAGTDAELVVGGKSATKAGQAWLYPSSGQCANCHTSAAGYSLGLEVAQLNTDFTYTATGRTANQLETLAAIGMFTAEIGRPSELPALRNPLDAAASLDDRARSYLHTNCAQCHQPGGPTPVSLDLRAATALVNTGTCNLEPTAGDLGIANALIVAPGEPARSVLLERMRRRDVNAMPPLASNLVDSAGAALLGDWIASLSANCQ